ncbi:MAG: N-formylglutamate amidohydrolase [Pseudomonadota bacterium]
MNVGEFLRETTKAFDLVRPAVPTIPLVVDSPHSWRHYPEGFKPACREDDLLTSWDAWVDELFGCTPTLGAPLLSARFPRFFIDPNRARDDIDSSLVDGTLPFSLNPTRKTEKGFGLLRRNALPGIRVYDAPIPAKTLLANIETYYDAYHARLGALIEETQRSFGRAIHLDCHSMKSRGNAMNDDPGAERPDIVVSDSFGTTADPSLSQRLATEFSKVGLRTQINDPYKGAELITRHSDPNQGRHSIQIEINRALYMDEQTFTKSDNFQNVQNQIETVLKALTQDM